MSVRSRSSRLPDAAWSALVTSAAAALSFAGPGVKPGAPSVRSGEHVPAFAPISYFNTSCASCHGPYGAAYGPAFGRGLSDKSLREKVEEMVFGPSQSSLGPAELDRLTAYHRSMIQRSPFVAIVERTETRLAGEVTPGSTVRVRVGERELQAGVRGHEWSLDLPAPLGGATPTVVAVGPAAGADGRPLVTTLDLARGSWSHADPLTEAGAPEPGKPGP
jgi:mono/diheme cytochrome c family protein